jgi:hypothetical protein
VRALVEGDVNAILPVYKEYEYVAIESAGYMYHTLNTSIPFEDIQQQAHYELLNILTNRACGSEKEGLHEVNESEEYESCLGIRPYLIKSVRGMLKLYIVERTGVISIRKVIYEKKYIEKHGEPNPPTCISNNAISGEGVSFEIPGSIPVETVQPIDIAIANEIRENLCLTSQELRILELRLEGKKLDFIAETLNIPRTNLFRKLQNIQNRYRLWKIRNDR